MENLRYLLAAIAALTLIMSVVSGVNPNYFAGLNAYADHDDEEEDDDYSGSGSIDDHDDEDDDEHDDDRGESGKNNDEHEDELVLSLGNHSKVTLEIDDDAELEVEIEDGDLDDGHYNVTFACDSPDIDEEFAGALDVEDGEGDFDTDLPLSNGTYTGCEVEVGELFATFPLFSIMAHEDNDEHEEEDDGDDEHEEENEEHERERLKSKLKTEDEGVEIEVEAEGLNMTDGSYDAVFACEQPALNLTLDNAFEVKDGKGELEETIGFANGTYSGCDITVEGMLIASFDTFTVSEETEEEQEHEVEEKRKEKKERMVTTTNGIKIHERHRGENAASPGEYQPGWNYTLTVNGTATQAGGSIPPEFKAVVGGLDISVWKSNRAIILLDVIGGTVEVENQTYTVVLGYALYTIHHDTLRVGALAVDDDGNVFKLKLRGSADDDAEFPMESGSLDLTFEGSSGPSNNRLGDLELTLEGTIEAG